MTFTLTAGDHPRREPELTHYSDQGCRVHPTCLDCPFLRCIYEEPRGTRHALNVERNEQIRRLYAAGESPQAIAAHAGLGVRAVYRIAGPPLQPAAPALPERFCAACNARLSRRAGEDVTSFTRRRTCNRQCGATLVGARRRRDSPPVAPGVCVICAARHTRSAQTCSGRCARLLMWQSRPRKADAPPAPDACVICQEPLAHTTRRTCSGSCARRLMWVKRRAEIAP